MTAQNNVNPISAIIAGVLRDEATSLNRSAALIEHMFNSEATFSAFAIAAIIKMQGEDRTAAIDAMIKDASQEFVGTLASLAAYKDMKASDRTEADKNAMETLNKQLRAARIMFTRAMYAVYGLRSGEHPALEIKASKRKTGSLAVEYLKERNGNKVKTVDKEQTCSELIRIGEKALNDALGKTKKVTTAKNPSASANLADSSKALAAVLTGVVNSKNPNRFDMLTNNKELEGNALTILASIIKIECSDEKGIIDTKALEDLLNRATGKAFAVKPVIAGKDAKAA